MLFVALIVLIVMTLAGLALLRQMGVGTSIAGNVAFKESATSVADRGTEVGRLWLQNNSAATSVDSDANGYRSSWLDGVDPTTYDWGNKSQTLADDFAQTGNTVRLMIHRLCLVPGLGALSPGQKCSDVLVTNPLSSHGGGGYPSVLPTTSPQPFYRVTTQVTGPRNTVSYTQVVLRPQ